jgi:hypothetical protein
MSKYYLIVHDVDYVWNDSKDYVFELNHIFMILWMTKLK